ncbi:MAG: DUF1616 domain-containing protein [Thermoproteus sp. AZ2]|uniref:DUF1616 domain-containing protein n=1 Tax=Thermoproteus sp. AZ2 TaxID=1609232 RepID=A0ACC6V2B5_9CREN
MMGLLLALAVWPPAAWPEALKAYSYVVELARLGANATPLIGELNKAIYLEEAGAPNASAVVNNVIAQAEAELPAASLSHWASIAVDAAVAVIALAALALLYAKRRELLGRLWLWARGRDRVRRGGPGKPRTLLFDPETAAVIAALVVAVAAFALAQALAAQRVEAFSAIGLLGPGGKIGGYPASVPVGQPVKLYIYVYNHEGAPAWFVVALYLTENASAQPPLGGRPFAVYQRVLANNESWVAPVEFSLNSTGSYRLVGELWMYSPVNQSLVYTGNYVQLWINATGHG